MVIQMIDLILSFVNLIQYFPSINRMKRETSFQKRGAKSEYKVRGSQKYKSTTKEKSQTKIKNQEVVFMLISDEEGAVSIPYQMWADPIKKYIKERARWCPVFKIWKVSRVQLEYIRRDLPLMLTASFAQPPSFVKLASHPLTAQKMVINKHVYTKKQLNLKQLPLYQNLYPFQRQTLNYCLRNHGRILIADQMGVGKSIQSLACCYLFPEDFPVLIICPSALKHVWKDEVGKWLKQMIHPEQVFIIKKGSLKNGQLSNAKVIIASYQIASKLVKQLAYISMVICDEAHYLKNPDTSRCTQLIPFLTKKKRIFLLTGTPALAKPKQLFNILGILRPDIFNNVQEFGERYCFKRRNPWTHRQQFDGAKNLAELHYILKKTVMIRRLKAEVLPQLPPKQRQIVYMETDKSVIAEIKTLLKGQIPLQNLRQSQRLMDVFNSEGEQREALVRCFLLSAMAKLNSMKQYISAILENDVKIIIFAHHQIVMDELQTYIKSLRLQYIRLDGSSSAETRKKKVDEFQDQFDIRVAILSITAIGVGFTLTAASTVIFAQLFWTPAVLIQAEDRAHRIGQQQSVNIHYLIGDKTIDPIMLRQLEKKIGIVTRVLDGQAESLNLQIIPQGELGRFQINGNESKRLKGSKITDYFTPVASQQRIDMQIEGQENVCSDDEQNKNKDLIQKIDRTQKKSIQRQEESEDSLLIEFIRKTIMRSTQK